MIRAITFDLDDTLWPIMPVIRHAEQRLYGWLSEHHPRVAEQHDFESVQQIRDAVMHDHPGLAHDFSALRRLCLERAMLPHGCTQADVEQAFEVFFQARNEVTLFDDVVPVLQRLSQRFLLGAISNGNADIERIGIGQWFSTSVHARQVGYAKPHQKVFLSAAEQLGLDPQQILHIGDHPEQDVMGALGAGFQAIWLNRASSAWPDLFQEPELVIDNLAQLEALIDQQFAAAGM